MKDQTDLGGKVVIVTGAGRGIGRDIALAAGAAGARVVVNDLGVSLGGVGADENPANEVAHEIRAAGGEAIACGDSVSDPAGARQIVRTALDSFGALDGVVNNAGILRDGFFHKMSEENWDAVIKVHLYGTFHVSRAAAEHFREKGGGSFVHMTSTSGLVGNIAQANYAAAKLGIVGLSRSIALDMHRVGVRSNCIAPFAWSRMFDAVKADTDAQRARIERMQKMTPAKVAPLCTYLLSDAAKDVTGQIFSVRNNEIYLFSQPRPVRSVHNGEGWTARSIADTAMPALAASFVALETSPEVFRWDPI